MDPFFSSPKEQNLHNPFFLPRGALVIAQLGYIYFLFANNAEFVNAAANVGSHYILSNALLAGSMLLWVRAEFWWSELVLLVNLYNLTSLYFRHTHVPRFVQIPVVAGPLAWAFVAIFWNGAAMVNVHTLLARVVANVFVWSFLLYGVFFLAAFKDTVMGFALAFLTMCESCCCCARFGRDFEFLWAGWANVGLDHI